MSLSMLHRTMARVDRFGLLRFKCSLCRGTDRRAVPFHHDSSRKQEMIVGGEGEGILISGKASQPCAGREGGKPANSGLGRIVMNAFGLAPQRRSHFRLASSRSVDRYADVSNEVLSAVICLRHGTPTGALDRQPHHRRGCQLRGCTVDRRPTRRLCPSKTAPARQTGPGRCVTGPAPKADPTPR